MRIFIFLSFFAQARALQKNVRRLKPEDIGPLHTDAFEQLTELYRNKQPKNQMEVMMDLSEIMEGYCDVEDDECRALAYEATMKEFHFGPRDQSSITYPDTFHAGLKESIDSMFDTIKTLDVDNLDEVVEGLEDIEDGMRNLDDVDAFEHVIGLSAVSIAVESTKLWHKVNYGSEEHPLRRLQQIILNVEQLTNLSNAQILGESLANVYAVIEADVSSAFAAGFQMIDVVGTNSFEVIGRFIPIVMISIAYFAVPASFAAAQELFNFS